MKVIHAKFGTGTIISQDANNVTVDFNGVAKILLIKFANLTNEDGTPFGNIYTAPPTAGLPAFIPAKKSASQKRREKANKGIAAFNAQDNLTKIKMSILRINGKVQGDRNSMGYQIISERLAGIYNIAKDQGNTFICDVINSVEKFMKASEKQAYVVAKYADDNGIIYE